jgi:adenosylcobyric acid synthase
VRSAALLITGTGSDAGKSVLVAGLCRALARQGRKVAPFKAQNMSLNSAVTPDGAEIGRAQAMQAAAAGIAPEAVMNPVLLKPTGDRDCQVVVLGRPAGDADAAGYQRRAGGLRGVVDAALADLRGRFDAVICEGAGSPAEINLRPRDLANMGLARSADLPTLVVGDIDRGGVFASLYGTLALLEPADQALIAGFVINKFRGDPAVLEPGTAQLTRLTGRRVLGVVPWVHGLWLDAEDALALHAPGPPSRPPLGRDSLEVAVVRVPRMSNFTDMDPLLAEAGVHVAFTDRPHDVVRADLAVLPGSKATVADLAWLRDRRLDAAIAERAERQLPTLGICGGYQMLGATITDDVESRAGAVTGLGLLPVSTAFAADKVLARPSGTSPFLGDVAASGYEIHHGRSAVTGGDPLLRTHDGVDEGCAAGTVLGTTWHGVLESDAFRRSLLSWVAATTGRDFVCDRGSFADVREAQLDLLGDLVTEHVDLDAVAALLDHGAPPGLAVIPPAGVMAGRPAHPTPLERSS